MICVRWYGTFWSGSTTVQYLLVPEYLLVPGTPTTQQHNMRNQPVSKYNSKVHFQLTNATVSRYLEP